MLHALLRKGIADLRSRPLQTTLLFVVVMAATAILMLAISIPQSIKISFDRAHDEAHGAHVWFGVNSVDVAEQVADLPGVVESTEVYEEVRGALMGTGEPDVVVFLGVGSDTEGISPAVIVEGRVFRLCRGECPSTSSGRMGGVGSVRGERVEPEQNRSGLR